MKKMPFLLFILISFSYSKLCSSQMSDSLVVYAISTTPIYHTRITKESIVGETKPIVITKVSTIDSIYNIINRSIKGKFIEELENNFIDIRLSIEFYHGGKIFREIGFASNKFFFIDKNLFAFDKKNFKYLDKCIPKLSSILKID